jgi:uncharacterized Zn finger protein
MSTVQNNTENREWLVECPACGAFVQHQRVDPTVCPKCQSADIDTTPVGSLEVFYASDQPEICRYCGKVRTDFVEVGNRQLQTCPECGMVYWTEEEK